MSYTTKKVSSRCLVTALPYRQSARGSPTPGAGNGYFLLPLRLDDGHLTLRLLGQSAVRRVLLAVLGAGGCVFGQTGAAAGTVSTRLKTAFLAVWTFACDRSYQQNHKIEM